MLRVVLGSEMGLVGQGDPLTKASSAIEFLVLSGKLWNRKTKVHPKAISVVFGGSVESAGRATRALQGSNLSLC